MCFQDGWPFIGCETNGDMIGEPVEEWELPKAGQPAYRIADSDEFETGVRACSGSGSPTPEKLFLRRKQKGSLKLACLANPERENLLWYAPNVMTQIPQSNAFTAEVKLKLSGGDGTEGCDGDMAVLGMTGHHYAFCGLERETKGFGCAFTKALSQEKSLKARRWRDWLLQRSGIRIKPCGCAWSLVKTKCFSFLFLTTAAPSSPSALPSIWQREPGQGPSSACGPAIGTISHQEDGENMITYTSATKKIAEEAFQAALLGDLDKVKQLAGHTFHLEPVMRKGTAFFIMR